MRRKIKVVLLALVACIQFAHTQHFEFGMTAGVLSSQFDGDRLFGFNKQGPIAGMNWYYNLNKSSQLQFDIDYMNIGSNYRGEKRPVAASGGNFNLMSLNLHSVSLFVGVNKDLVEYEKGLYRYKFSAGLRLSRAFVFRTYLHNTSQVEYFFDDTNITKTFVAPEARLGAYISPQLSVQLVIATSFNNMILNEENSITLLRPFYFGVTASYVLKTKSKKKRRRR